MADEDVAVNPSENLAGRILDKLAGDRLVSLQRREELRRKLVAGSMKARDWTILMLAAAPRDSVEGGNAEPN